MRGQLLSGTQRTSERGRTAVAMWGRYLLPGRHPRRSCSLLSSQDLLDGNRDLPTRACGIGLLSAR